MLKKNVVENTVLAALGTGADFAEIYMEETKRNTLSVVNGRVESAQSGLDYGVGIRLFFGNKAIYGFTNDTSEKNLIRIAREAAAAARGERVYALQGWRKMNFSCRNPIRIMPDEVEKRKKAEKLFLASEAAKNYSSLITQTRANCLDVVQNVFIANSEGLWAEEQRVRSRFNVEAIASSATEKQSGHLGPGGSVGFELYEQIDVEERAREAARIAVTMLGAKPCPAGRMPVVIENGFGGVIFHEACGHSLEATAVARNASVFCGKMGQQIASSVVTAIDDGTIPNGWGSAAMDDEGTPTQRNVLIENGVLRSYLVDKLNGRRMGAKSTGSSRRESYRFAPTSRMTNTFIDNGKSTPTEILGNTEFGLYAKQMGGGSVDPATGSFNFAVLEGYMIRDGKIAEPVRGATLIGKGTEVLQKIDMVGNNLARAQGMCGSISGSIPTDVGQPMIRVKEITVGGRG
ncbi:metalloprotease TldD [Anaerotignum neopropionicum]|uniref:Metalloprotease TldD n=1 Tax=Anaerotignum neopropionicum TaxID=36847 RepID=A0A136WIW6_9FIRM|nr:TldD/PmbA family protein [Anaerotignum neopropionicum]KXL54471.1 metalloprotease TldD [Anaerotignum neopropionicum]